MLIIYTTSFNLAAYIITRDGTRGLDTDRIWALLMLVPFCFLESDRAITCVALAAESYFFRQIVVMELLVLSTFELPALIFFALYMGVLLPTTPTHLRLRTYPT